MKKTLVTFLVVSAILTCGFITVCFSGSTNAYSDIIFYSNYCCGNAQTVANPGWNYMYISHRLKVDGQYMPTYTKTAGGPGQLKYNLTSFTGWETYTSCYDPVYHSSYHYCYNYSTGASWSASGTLYEYP